MKRILYSALCATALLAGLGACSGNQDSVDRAQNTNEARNENATANTEMGDLKQDKMDFDTDFMTKAASGGMLEVELGKAVEGKAVTPEAKQVAQKMIADHTKANDELKSIAAKNNITIPGTLGDDQQDVYRDVTDETGIDLDKKYMKEMEKDHQHDVELFTEASVKATNPEVKAFAAKTLPVLKEHLSMITQMMPAVENHQ